MTKKLHIVCLDAPSPPDYGGAMEMFFKVKALAEQGVDITLHYFAYRNQRNAAGLEAHCSEIIPYRRKGLSAHLFAQPYIVSSRINKQLVRRLNRDNGPVLLEGLHCTGIIPFLQPKERTIIVRLHNNEAAYYKQLARTETNWFKRLYFATESRLLHHYQQQLPPTALYAALSQTDQQTFTQVYQLPHVAFLPLFLPWQRLLCEEGAGSYCLYHGNLSVAENERAALWLVHHVFSNLPVPLVIAGKNASAKLKKEVERHRHIRLANSPDETTMQQLVAGAHIHLLPSFNTTGVKFKLLNALLNGRFCITNRQGAAGSGLETFVRLAELPAEYRQAILQCMQEEFTKKEKKERKEILRFYNNAANAAQLITYLS